MSKKVKLRFVDFWPGFDANRNSFVNALLTKYQIEMSDDPDYLFYSCFGNDHLKYANSVRIFVTLEAVVPDFNLCDYSIGYDYIDFGDRHLRVSNYSFSQLSSRKQPKTVEQAAELLRNKTGFCNFIYSNSIAHPARDTFFAALNRQKMVDSLGSHLYNMGDDYRDFHQTRQGDWFQTSIDQKSKYKFSIAFENATHAGYTTEKIVSSLMANTVPIYWGDPEVARVYSSGSIINCHEFGSFEAVINEVIRIDHDDDAWCRRIVSDPLTEQGNEELQTYQDRVDAFLFRIFDQHLVDARRRGVGPWNDRCFWRARNAESLERRKKKLNLGDIPRAIVRKVRGLWAPR